MSSSSNVSCLHNDNAPDTTSLLHLHHDDAHISTSVSHLHHEIATISANVSCLHRDTAIFFTLKASSVYNDTGALLFTLL
jgi:hypothetical protein